MKENGTFMDALKVVITTTRERLPDLYKDDNEKADLEDIEKLHTSARIVYEKLLGCNEKNK